MNHPDPLRQTILDAADRMFLRYGYRKTTIEDIAREAGIGKGSVYLHFQSKEEIGGEWMDQWHTRVFQEMRDRVDAQERYPDKLRAFLMRRVMGRYCSLERWQMSLDEVMCNLQPLIQTHKAKFQEREGAYARALLEEGIRRGEFRPFEPEKVTTSILLATNALLPNTLRPDQIGSKETVEQRASDLVDLLLQAIEPKENHS